MVRSHPRNVNAQGGESFPSTVVTLFCVLSLTYRLYVYEYVCVSARVDVWLCERACVCVCVY